MRLGSQAFTWTHAATGALLTTAVAALLVLPGRLLDVGGDVPVAPIALPAPTAPAPVQALPVVVHHAKPRTHHIVRQAQPTLVVAHVVPTRPVTAEPVAAKPVAVAPPVTHVRVPLVQHVTAISRAALSKPVRLTKHETPPEPVAPPAPTPAPAPTQAPAPAPTPAPAPVAAPMEVPAAVSPPAPPAPAPLVETAVAAVLPDDEHGHDHDHGHGGEHGRGHGHDR